MFLDVYGHKAYAATICPGDTWDDWRYKLDTDDEPPPTDCEEKLLAEQIMNAELQIRDQKKDQLLEEMGVLVERALEL